MFFLAHHQHRARRGTHYSFGRASDAKMSQTGVAVRGHHDKIDIELFGCIDDFVRSDSLPRHCAHVSDSFLAGRNFQGIQSSCRVRPTCFLDRQPHREAFKCKWHDWFENVKQRHFGTEFTGEAQRVFQTFLGCRRKVGWRQYFFDRDWRMSVAAAVADALL